MATTITPVQSNHINHAILIDLTLDSTTYYISSAYKPITYNSNTYTELGNFLNLTDIQEDIKSTTADLNVSLSAIPSEQDYLNLILTTPIKGGEIIIYRAFFEDDYSLNSSNVFQRYRGIITNYNISEETDIIAGENTNRVTVACSSIIAILEAKTTGQRTNPNAREKYYPGDQTFKRVPDLHNVSFDFGREYTGGTGYGGGYGGGGYFGGGGFGPGFNPFSGINIR